MSLYGYGRGLTISDLEGDLVCLKGASLNQWNFQVKGFDLYLYPLFTLKEKGKIIVLGRFSFYSLSPRQ